MCGPNTPIASIRLDYLMIAYSHSKSVTQEQAWTAVFDCKSKPSNICGCVYIIVHILEYCEKERERARVQVQVLERNLTTMLPDMNQ